MLELIECEFCGCPEFYQITVKEFYLPSQGPFAPPTHSDRAYMKTACKSGMGCIGKLEIPDPSDPGDFSMSVFVYEDCIPN